MKIIGIDPGANGAITCIDETGKVESIKVMPKISSDFDGNQFNKILENYDSTQDIKCVYIEDVHAIFGSAAKATFTFGKICGIIEGIIIAHHLPYIYVQPKAWQKEMFQGVKEVRNPKTKRIDTKAMSELACKRLFPDVKFTATDRCTKTHDGMTDATLIAEYGRRKVHEK
jgi:hypothetical protein